MLNFDEKDQVFTNTMYTTKERGMFGSYTATHFKIEDELSTEQKLEILNQYTDDNFSYFMLLNDKYIMERDTGKIKRDKWGNLRETTKFAWIRNNDYKHIFWDGKNKGSWSTKEYYRAEFFGYGNDLYFGHAVNETTINKIFGSLIYDLYKKEISYFQAHDEYEILKQKYRDSGCPNFGVHIATCSNGHIYVVSDENSDDERDITIDELKVLLEKNELLLEYKQKLANEVHITF